MKKSLLILSGFLSLFVLSCKKDDGVSCVTCTSEATTAFELCKESDGNASVNGENTNTPYHVYLNDLEEEGVLCVE